VTVKEIPLIKNFCGGPGCTYSAVFRNPHGDDTSFEASYAVLALQMLPPRSGVFIKRAPLAAGGKKNAAYFSRHEKYPRNKGKNIHDMGLNLHDKGCFFHSTDCFCRSKDCFFRITDTFYRIMGYFFHSTGIFYRIIDCFYHISDNSFHITDSIFHIID
jgi:hypothetical protein